MRIKSFEKEIISLSILFALIEMFSAVKGSEK